MNNKWLWIGLGAVVLVLILARSRSGGGAQVIQGPDTTADTQARYGYATAGLEALGSAFASQVEAGRDVALGTLQANRDITVAHIGADRDVALGADALESNKAGFAAQVESERVRSDAYLRGAQVYAGSQRYAEQQATKRTAWDDITNVAGKLISAIF